MADPLAITPLVCCLCGEPIEEGFDITDDEGNVYGEECWQP